MELTPKLKLTAAVALALTFIGGVFTGREMIKAELRQGLKTALAPLVSPEKPEEPDKPKEPKQKLDGSQIVTDVNPMDDTTKYTLVMRSSNTNANSIGMKEHDHLIIRCEAGDLDLYIATSAYLSSDGQSVKLRFDKGEVTSHWWSGSSAGSALFSGAPLSRMLNMLAHQELTIEFKPWRETKDFATFDLKPYHKDIDKMMGYCK